MQLRNQFKQPRDWKVVAGAGALAALGITGLVVASPADGSVPGGISLEERAKIAQAKVPAPLPANQVVDLSSLQSDLDSPFADGPRGGAGADDSAASDDSPPARGGGQGGDDDSPTSPAQDSPDDSPAPRTGGGDDDSPASPPAQDSPDSPDSPDSVDGSADS